MLQHPLLISLNILWGMTVSFLQSFMVLSHLNYYLLYALYFMVYPLSLTPSGTFVSTFCACYCLPLYFPSLVSLWLFLYFHNTHYLLLCSIYLFLWVYVFPFLFPLFYVVSFCWVSLVPLPNDVMYCCVYAFVVDVVSSFTSCSWYF